MLSGVATTDRSSRFRRRAASVRLTEAREAKPPNGSPTSMRSSLGYSLDRERGARAPLALESKPRRTRSDRQEEKG